MTNNRNRGGRPRKSMADRIKCDALNLLNHRPLEVAQFAGKTLQKFRRLSTEARFEWASKMARAHSRRAELEQLGKREAIIELVEHIRETGDPRSIREILRDCLEDNNLTDEFNARALEEEMRPSKEWRRRKQISDLSPTLEMPRGPKVRRRPN